MKPMKPYRQPAAKLTINCYVFVNLFLPEH
jgi:hypothetical protein